MTFEILESLLLATFRGSLPLILVAFAGLISERSGVIQIALEGFMLIGALVAAIVTFRSHNPALGILAAMAASAAIAGLYAFFVLNLKADQIVAGTGINILSFGMAPFITKLVFDSTGSTPSIDIEHKLHNSTYAITVLVAAVLIYFFHFTRLGLILQFSGEKPEVLKSNGFSILKVRWISLLICGALAGIGGSFLSTAMASNYSPQMTAGRGFIALAALIFGRWKPIPTLLACLLFSFADALQMTLQGNQSFIPVAFIQILPYLITIVALAGFFGHSRAPKSLGQK